MSSVFPNGGRLAQIADRAALSFPPIPPLSDDPTPEEQIAAWRQLAAGYATIAHSYREAVPLLVQEIHALRAEVHTTRALVESLIEEKTARAKTAKRLPRRVR